MNLTDKINNTISKINSSFDYKFGRKKKKSADDIQNQMEEKAKYYTATQWQLIWWRFKKHKLSLIGMTILSVFLLMSLFPEFIASYSPTSRDTEYVDGPPQLLRFKNPEGKFSILPYIYGVTQARNPETLAFEFKENMSEGKRVKFFVRGESYKIFGFIPGSIHLFGVEDGFFHIWGTDDLGRDIYSRTIYATRTSLSIGLIGLLISFYVGLLLGGISGFFGGWVDNIIQRFIEFVRSIPTFPLWLGLAAAIPREWSAEQVYFMITIILGLVGWTTLARRTRSLFMSIREEDFILAAKLSGASNYRIITRHMMPSFISYIIVELSIAFPTMILSETSLSFIGLGLRPPVTSWGVLLKSAQNIRSITESPWVLIPAIFVILAVLSFSFVGDGLRDAADPYSENT